jgi:putative heme-binding domain-containing protein
LEALVSPGARIAPGYGNVTLTLNDGSTVHGLLQQEDDVQLVIQTADEGTQNVSTTRIVERRNAPSAMPPMAEVLKRRELRDMIAFLVTLDGK